MPYYPVNSFAEEDATSIQDMSSTHTSHSKQSRFPSIPRETRGRNQRNCDGQANSVDDNTNQLSLRLLERQDLEERSKVRESQSSTETRKDSSHRRRSRGASTASSVSPHSTWSNLCPPPSTLPLDQSPSSERYPSSQRDRIGNHGPEKIREAAKKLPPLQIPHLEPSPFIEKDDDHHSDDDIDRFALQEEYDRRWILNLSMHFRDKSNREKFFVTYAEKPNMWRRVTVSLDYRNPYPDSLEYDLSTLTYQRDKSLRIFEAIRESLAEIEYYDTVTNLKLETSHEDGQLHVHVREDVNEIINFPAISSFDHIRCPRFNESAIDFDSHLSGFVYKVKLADRIVIKKEIPGPDTVDEFLYEVNALDSLIDSSNVIHLEGLVTDDRGLLVKGLLISYAPQGSLVDMIYDLQETPELPWYRREKWAKQIVTGLSNIHEAGFVQGDFTLSNIVIDDNDDAQIIDINRRGCPVGWEPPELGKLIESGQRIGMCIGVKTDIFQLGMVLWALAEKVDEPERVERPLRPVADHVPTYFREMVATCLSERPQHRASAKDLIREFPASAGRPTLPAMAMNESLLGMKESIASTTHRSAKEYIDPAMAVTIDDVNERRRSGENESQFIMNPVTFVNQDSNPASSSYHFETEGSWVVGRRSRGRSPISSRRRRSSPFDRTVSSATSFSEISPARCFEPSVTHNNTGDAKLQDLRALLSQPSYLNLGNNPPVMNINIPNQPGMPPPLANRRVTAVQDQIHPAHLLHIDSGFDELMDDLELSDSHITEKGDRDSTSGDHDSQLEHAKNLGHQEPQGSRAYNEFRRPNLVGSSRPK